MDQLIEKLRRDFPELNFKIGKKFAFRFPKTITINPDEPEAKLLTLHELGHAVLGHRDFSRDVKRLKMEVEAWEKVREFAKTYNIAFDEEIMQSELDTYRDWLHKKSRCPKCGLTRFQDADGVYHCPRCENLA